MLNSFLCHCCHCAWMHINLFSNQETRDLRRKLQRNMGNGEQNGSSKYMFILGKSPQVQIILKITEEHKCRKNGRCCETKVEVAIGVLDGIF